MSRRTMIISLTAMLVPLVTATAQVASAARLGTVSSRNLGAWNATGPSGAPTVAAWDSFTRAAGTNLDGQPSGGGGPAWQAVAGIWTSVAGGTAHEIANTTAALVVDCGRTDATATVVLVSSSGNFSAGLALKSVPSGFISVELSKNNGGRVDVETISGGNRASVGSATQLGNTLPVTLSATYAAGVITVRLNGAVVVTTPKLSATDLATFGSSTSFGLHTQNDTATRFDDFRCEY